MGPIVDAVVPPVLLGQEAGRGSEGAWRPPFRTATRMGEVAKGDEMSSDTSRNRAGARNHRRGSHVRNGLRAEVIDPVHRTPLICQVNRHLHANEPCHGMRKELAEDVILGRPLALNGARAGR